MDNLAILVTFAVGLGAALVFGYIAQRIKLSPIVGYLLAGILVGPFTPGIVVDHGITEQFAEIGVILMLFGIGLRFHLDELIAVWKTAVPGALIQSSVSTAVLAGIMHIFGMDWVHGIILGMAVSVASTVVMALVLNERHDLHARIGHIAIGWTVVEDILTVAMLLLLPIVFSKNGAGSAQQAAVALGMAAAKIIGLVGVVFILGRWVIPWLLDKIALTRSRELFTLAVLVLAIGIAIGSATVFGVSVALGAFLAGLAVGRSEFATRASGDAVPMRDAFTVLFFVSIGMLFNPKSLLEAPLLIGMVLLVVIGVKPLVAILTMRLLKHPWTTAIPVGAAFSQVGEFSFILGSVAKSLDLIDGAAFDAIVAASIISITLNPMIYGTLRNLASRIGRGTPTDTTHELVKVDHHRTILVGYGPVGQIVCRLLKERGHHVTIIDLNHETIRKLKAAGLTAIYGDILQAGTLETAGIATAGSLILSADIEDASELIRNARAMNPRVRILARCTHLRDTSRLKAAGADVVAAGEAEVGVALAEEVTAVDEWDDMTAAEHRDVIRKKLYDNPRGAFINLPSPRPDIPEDRKP
ncbi:MAG TPA: cation:proton antiporter [Myxococcota bacterium]|nr:cation:proton antiporter [Myxococcota bacterium]HNZ03280.1 cation:proton antiporter [Myxococcota bacterium]HPB50852.1 cation:proton antiporter [Myxococcota bacterium]HQP95844.1 cation:proton antiporter [Myxococcota bacterium]